MPISVYRIICQKHCSSSQACSPITICSSSHGHKSALETTIPAKPLLSSKATCCHHCGWSCLTGLPLSTAWINGTAFVVGVLIALIAIIIISIDLQIVIFIHCNLWQSLWHYMTKSFLIFNELRGAAMHGIIEYYWTLVACWLLLIWTIFWSNFAFPLYEAGLAAAKICILQTVKPQSLYFWWNTLFPMHLCLLPVACFLEWTGTWKCNLQQLTITKLFLALLLLNENLLCNLRPQSYDDASQYQCTRATLVSSRARIIKFPLRPWLAHQ